MSDAPRVAYVSHGRFPADDIYSVQIVKTVSALASTRLPVELVVPRQTRALFHSDRALGERIRTYYGLPSPLDVSTVPFVPASRSRLQIYTHPFAAALYTTLKRFDIIYTRDELTAIIALLLNKRLVFETYKLLGDRYPRAVNFLSKLSRDESFIGAILHSQLAADSLQRSGFARNKLAVIHNGFDPRDVEPAMTASTAKRTLGIDPEAFCLVYTGSMQRRKCVESIIDVAARVEDVECVLVGGSARDNERLRTYAAKTAVQVRLVNHRPPAQIRAFLYAADALIIPPVSAPLVSYGTTVLPIKLFHYLACGRPILAPNQPDMREVLTDGHTALLVEPDNLPAAAAGLRRLRSDPDLRRHLATNALARSRSLTWQARGDRIVDWLQRQGAVRP